MKIKDFKKQARAEANNIEIAPMREDVSNCAKALAVDSKPRTSKFSFGRKQAIVLSLCSLAVILIVVVSIVIFSGRNTNILVASNVARPVGSANTISRLMSKYDSRNSRNWFNFGAKESAPAGAVDDSFNYSDAPNSGTSQTISQVEGIQESEIVKCDNNHIYYAVRNSVEIYEVANGKAEVVKKIQLQNQLYYYQDEEFVYDYYFTPIQMYVTDANLIIMYEKIIKTNYKNLVRSYWYGFYGNTFETVLQIYDKNDFNLTKEISVPGSLIDGRVYNNFIYFITAENIVDYKIASVVENVGSEENKIEFDYDDVIYVPEYIDYPYENYICSVNLNTLDANYECQLGSNSYGTIYMSENALYMCNTCYTDSNPSEIIYKYAINEEGYLKFTSSGKVNGYVNNQYYLDEYNGYLRIATTGRFYHNGLFNSYRSEVINAVYVLEEKEVYGGKVLEIVGKLDEGIGYPGEQIKSVKFDKEYVSIVTYYQTDPLYLIKFTDNNKIEIVDYLKVPGYSTFLLDININGAPYKIGVGLTDNRNYKVSLYQVVDEQVSQIGKDYVIKSTTYINDDNGFDYFYSYIDTPVIDNIRTMLLFQDENGTTFIGMNLDENINSRKNDATYEYEQLGKYLLLRIDLEDKDAIVLVNELNANSQSARMVVVNGYFYLVSMGEAKGYTYNNETKTLDLVE